MIHAIVLFLAIQASAQDPAAHQNAGIAALKAAQNDQAIAEFKKVIELDPANAAGYFGLGVAYMQSREKGAAIQPLKKALELDPTLTVVHKPLGDALLAQGYAAEAVPQFEKAHDKAGLGIAQLNSGDLPNAVQNLQSALASKPNDPDLMYYLARATGLLSKELYDTLLAAYPNSARANLAAAENYAALRQGQEAEAHYQAALKQQPDLPGAHLALGQFYATASKWKEAEDEFRAEAKLEPGNAEAGYRLGAALILGGNHAIPHAGWHGRAGHPPWNRQLRRDWVCLDHADSPPSCDHHGREFWDANVWRSVPVELGANGFVVPGIDGCDPGAGFVGDCNLHSHGRRNRCAFQYAAGAGCVAGAEPHDQWRKLLRGLIAQLERCHPELDGAHGHGSFRVHGARVCSNRGRRDSHLRGNRGGSLNGGNFDHAAAAGWREHVCVLDHRRCRRQCEHADEPVPVVAADWVRDGGFRAGDHQFERAHARDSWRPARGRAILEARGKRGRSLSSVCRG